VRRGYAGVPGMPLVAVQVMLFGWRSRVFLETLDLGRYAEVFVANDVDEAVLAHLTDANLKELGVISLGHRKRLLAAMASRWGIP
jgi:SAM domain (Sterile alpha motif)